MESNLLVFGGGNMVRVHNQSNSANELNDASHQAYIPDLARLLYVWWFSRAGKALDGYGECDQKEHLFIFLVTLSSDSLQFDLLCNNACRGSHTAGGDVGAASNHHLGRHHGHLHSAR